MKNSIFKINLIGKIGIGFLLKIPFNKSKDNLMPVLIANIILNKNEQIKSLTINNSKIIKIDKSRKISINSYNNIIIIEIKPIRDHIYIDEFLELDENYIYKNKESSEYYDNKPIYILNYQNEKPYASYGSINNKINDKKIEYGSTILLLETFKIIGIYYDNSKNHNMNYSTFIKYLIDEFNNYKNEINIIYKTEKEVDENIFGYKFVENNKNNIELIINENKTKLIHRYRLKEGGNNIKIIIKNKITNLEYMFYNCRSLKNIKELEYLDTRDIDNFSYMFSGCCSLLDIRALENWIVKNGKNFSSMFQGCSSLSDLKALQNWDVSNGENFSLLFEGCSSLSDLKGLQNWKVSNGNDFSSLFKGCSSLSDIQVLENWNVSNGKYFSSMFKGCSSLLDINALEWNVSNGKYFDYMFEGCSSLSNIKVLENWNVSNGNNFNSMFYDCLKLSNIEALQKWNVSNGNDFRFMFKGCLSLLNIKGLQNWNVSKG